MQIPQRAEGRYFEHLTSASERDRGAAANRNEVTRDEPG